MVSTLAPHSGGSSLGAARMSHRARENFRPAPRLPLQPIRSWMGRFYLLVDGPRSVLLDTGFFGERRRILRALATHGLGPRDLAAILLTHGHLDHAGNLAWLREQSGAPVYAHAAEQVHLEGTFRYRGWARVGGALESAGRAILRYRPVPIDRPIADGDELPFWGGLKVVHLPGHTDGHCGFYSAKFDLLFVGDLFAGFSFSVHRPPAVFNSRPELIPASLAKAAAVGAGEVVPNHTFSDDFRRHAKSLKILSERY